MADCSGVPFLRLLFSADLFTDEAMRFGSEDLNMLFSRSIALLVAVTLPDHLRAEDFFVRVLDFFDAEDFFLVLFGVLVDRDLLAIAFNNIRTRMIPDHKLSSMYQSIWRKI